MKNLMDSPRVARPRSFVSAGRLAALQTADGFFLLHTAQFTFGDKPSFAAYGTQNAAFDHFLAEPFKQLILGLILTNNYCCHLFLTSRLIGEWFEDLCCIGTKTRLFQLNAAE
jgi:hypothetical protein